MSDNHQNDPYIGKIIRRTGSFDFDNSSSVNDGISYLNSLFLVVGVGIKRYTGKHDLYYILKPLNNDEENRNPHKELVWYFRFMVDPKKRQDLMGDVVIVE